MPYGKDSSWDSLRRNQLVGAKVPHRSPEARKQKPEDGSQSTGCLTSKAESSQQRGKGGVD